MESKKIKNILSQFEEKDTYNKIFINGSWGIGKSFYTEEYRKENPSNIVYISLFGKENFESIEDSIVVELLNKYMGCKKTFKQISNFTKRISGSISIGGISISSPSLEKKNFFKNYSKILENNKLIIIIDDLERKSSNINIEDVMGLIEQFSQYDNIKVLVIGSEENMDEEDKTKWTKFKEKIIEKEYNITSFSEEAIESLVIGKLKQYIPSTELKKFIKDFLEKHKTKNLRSIEKGVNLFLEVVENYINKKYNSNIYMSILKNCMAVAIEYTEQLYKPEELKPEEKGDFVKSLTYSTDEDMYSRIISHYFHSIFIVKKESSILEYIMSFYSGEINDSIIESLNNTIENYMNKEDEKNIFYLSEEDIISEINEKYYQIVNDNYIFSTIDQLIDDINEIIKWNSDLDIGLDISILSDKFNSILFKNYYSIEKEMYQNTIGSFELKRRESKKLEEIISNYNNICREKYSIDKLNILVEEYNNRTYNEEKLQWLDWSLLQDNKDIIKKYVMSEFKKYNYLIPTLSGEITEKEWEWTHKIWKIYHEKFDDSEKKQINESVEKMKSNKISTSRIETLQSYRPLINKK